MPGEDKPTQQTRQRKKGKKSRSKGKSQSSRPGPSVDGQGDLLAPPLLQPAPKKVVEEKRKEPEVTVQEESSVAVCLQVLLPYLLAGMGMVMAGMVLDYVQYLFQRCRIISHEFGCAPSPNAADPNVTKGKGGRGERVT